jgi:GNAT superfamily N-acetyltransferase
MPTLELANGYYELPQGKLVNVATFLELTSKPDRKLNALPPGVALERVDPNRLEDYRSIFRKVGEDWMWFSRILMPDEELTAILAHPDVSSFYLTDDGERMGLLELDFSKPPECELAFFGVAHNAIGKGLGRALMDEAITMAWQKPIARIWVHTCTLDHPAALSFYMRSGFKPYKRMIEYHDDPRLLGKLPRSASPQIPVLD